MLKALVVVMSLSAASGFDACRAAQAFQSASASLPDGQFVTMPSITSRVMPALSAFPAASAGDVDIQTVVSATGTVAHVRVAKSPDPSGALDRSCVDALRQWQFGPAMSNGRPIASLVLVRFSFPQPASTPSPVVTATLTTVEYSAPPQVWTPTAGQISAVSPGPANNVKWPSIIREVKPRYTQAAVRAKIVGQVELEVTVAPDGTVGAAKVTKGLDADNGLDNAALVAARYWLFNPGTREGAPVPTKVGLVLEFRLN